MRMECYAVPSVRDDGELEGQAQKDHDREDREIQQHVVEVHRQPVYVNAESHLFTRDEGE